MCRYLRKGWECFSAFILAVVGIYSVLPETVKIRQNAIKFMTEHPNSGDFISAFFIAFGISAFFCMIYDLYEEKSMHRLKIGSKKFYEFFSEWYSKQGELTIICDDLDWIVPEDRTDMSIMRTLETKAHNQKVNFILKKDALATYKYEEHLKKLGAKVYYTTGMLFDSYSFSALSKMGNNTVIIARKKSDDDGDWIKFRDINNAYVTGLLNNLIENLKKEGSHV